VRKFSEDRLALPRGATKACKFCAIVAGTEKSYPVLSDALALAFLDYRPLALGHVLLVPRQHYPTLDTVPDDVIEGLGVRVKRLSGAVREAMQAEGSFVALNNVVSQSVPHVHFHVVPRRRDDRLFSSGLIWKRMPYKNDAQREEVAARIRAALEGT
jgi:histidine triad (HIT) family protein